MYVYVLQMLQCINIISISTTEPFAYMIMYIATLQTFKFYAFIINIYFTNDLSTRIMITVQIENPLITIWILK